MTTNNNNMNSDKKQDILKENYDRSDTRSKNYNINSQGQRSTAAVTVSANNNRSDYNKGKKIKMQHNVSENISLHQTKESVNKTTIDLNVSRVVESQLESNYDVLGGVEKSFAGGQTNVIANKIIGLMSRVRGITIDQDGVFIATTHDAQQHQAEALQVVNSIIAQRLASDEKRKAQDESENKGFENTQKPNVVHDNIKNNRSSDGNNPYFSQNFKDKTHDEIKQVQMEHKRINDNRGERRQIYGMVCTSTELVSLVQSEQANKYFDEILNLMIVWLCKNSQYQGLLIEDNKVSLGDVIVFNSEQKELFMIDGFYEPFTKSDNQDNQMIELAQKTELNKWIRKKIIKRKELQEAIVQVCHEKNEFTVQGIDINVDAVKKVIEFIKSYESSNSLPEQNAEDSTELQLEVNDSVTALLEQFVVDMAEIQTAMSNDNALKDYASAIQRSKDSKGKEMKYGQVKERAKNQDLPDGMRDLINLLPAEPKFADLTSVHQGQIIGYFFTQLASLSKASDNTKYTENRMQSVLSKQGSSDINVFEKYVDDLIEKAKWFRERAHGCRSIQNNVQWMFYTIEAQGKVVKNDLQVQNYQQFHGLMHLMQIAQTQKDDQPPWFFAPCFREELQWQSEVAKLVMNRPICEFPWGKSLSLPGFIDLPAESKQTRLTIACVMIMKSDKPSHTFKSYFKEELTPNQAQVISVVNGTAAVPRGLDQIPKSKMNAAAAIQQERSEEKFNQQFAAMNEDDRKTAQSSVFSNTVTEMMRPKVDPNAQRDFKLLGKGPEAEDNV